MDKQKFMQAFNQNDALSNHLGISVTKLEDGYAEVHMTITADHLNFMGTLHGGTLFSLADVASGTAVCSYGQHCVTLNSSISYIRAVKEGDILAKAKVTHAGRTTAVCDVKIYDAQSRLLVTSTYTMFMTGQKILL